MFPSQPPPAPEPLTAPPLPMPTPPPPTSTPLPPLTSSLVPPVALSCPTPWPSPSTPPPSSPLCVAVPPQAVRTKASAAERAVRVLREGKRRRASVIFGTIQSAWHPVQVTETAPAAEG